MKRPPLITKFSTNPSKKNPDKNLQAEIVSIKPTKPAKGAASPKPPKPSKRNQSF